LSHDGDCHHNLAAEDPKRTATFREDLFSKIKSLRGEHVESESTNEGLTPALREQLRDLGYMD